MRRFVLTAVIVILMMTASLVVPISQKTEAAQGDRCGINFGDQPTFMTADNGCLFNSPDKDPRTGNPLPRMGGIPEGWHADTPSGTAWGPTVISVPVATLRTNDGSPPPPFQEVSQPPSQPPSGTGGGILFCPQDQSQVTAALGIPSGSEQWWEPIQGDPGAWVYNREARDPRAPWIRFVVPQNFTADAPQGMKLPAGTQVNWTVVVTIRCGAGL